jgi:uncharacterized membrane protein
MRRGQRLQITAAGLLVTAYAVASHYLNSHPGDDLQSGVASSGRIAALWQVLRHHFSLLSLLQESTVYGALGLTFALSLRRNKTPLCTRFADQVHGPLTPDEVAYTRRVTAAWAIFFITVDILSLLLYLRAPLRLWSIFINFCVLPLVATMFIAEFLVRGWVLPQGRRAGLLAPWRVYSRHPRS